MDFDLRAVGAGGAARNTIRAAPGRGERPDRGAVAARLALRHPRLDLERGDAQRTQHFELDKRRWRFMFTFNFGWYFGNGEKQRARQEQRRREKAAAAEGFE